MNKKELSFIKQQKLPLPMSMTIFMKMKHLFVEGVTRRSFRRRASLMPDVDGQASMKASQMQ
jgi:hypothetical protein